MTSIYHECNWPVSWQATQTTVGAAHKSPPSCSYELPTNVAITPALQVATRLRAAKALNGVCWCRARWIKRKRALLTEGGDGGRFIVASFLGQKASFVLLPRHPPPREAYDRCLSFLGEQKVFLKRVGLLVPRRELPCEQWLVGRAVLEAAPALLHTSCGAYGGVWLSTFSDLTPFLPLSSRLP